MANILSIVTRLFKEIDSFWFDTSNFDEFRKEEALRIAYQAMVIIRI